MLRHLVASVMLIACASLICAQNDDRKDVEWDENDPRWDTKIPNWWDEENFVPPVGPIEERSKAFWVNKGQNLLNQKVSKKLNTNRAKNLVIFIGDGMGLATLMATRSYLNDVKTELSFEKFPHSGLSKTYCINYQIPDSSCTATAILTGIKNNYGTIAMSGDVNLRNCSAQRDNNTHVDSIFKHAQDAGKSTGVVTTTRVTHATPAAAYAKSSSRYWESDEGVPEGCNDIAYQMIHGEIGSKLDVVMGGGRRNFLPTNDNAGVRIDNRNLIDEYLTLQTRNNKKAQVVHNRTDLQGIDAAQTDKILGLFASSHMDYNLLSDPQVQPSLTEMTTKALDVLRKNDKGFILLVEGGRIDTAHHETTARLALDETVEFQKAVEYVRNITSEEDTLIIVTADHSTALSVAGYMPRGYNILGPGDFSRTDQMWFFALSYANGPGHADHVNPSGGRQNPRGKKYTSSQFRQATGVPEEEETHAGEDVGVYASGPFSHIFSGVYEQNYIAHAMAYATCLGPDDYLKNPQCTDNAVVKSASVWVLVAAFLLTSMITIFNSQSFQLN